MHVKFELRVCFEIPLKSLPIFGVHISIYSSITGGETSSQKMGILILFLSVPILFFFLNREVLRVFLKD